MRLATSYSLLKLLLTRIAFKKLETARIGYDYQVVEFKTSCENNIYICGLLLKTYVMNALGLMLGQKQINKVSEVTSCLNSDGHVLVYHSCHISH